MNVKLLNLPITLLKTYIVLSTECINRIYRNPNTSYAVPSASKKMRPFHQMTSLGKALVGQQNITQFLGGLQTKNSVYFFINST